MLLQCSMICFMFKHQQPMLTLGECWQLYSKTCGRAVCDAKVYTYTSVYEGHARTQALFLTCL